MFHLPLEKPDIKVSPAALAYRGPGGQNPLLADLKPAFDAFRASDYQRADGEFSALSGKYPKSIEIAFYQGVARLFGGNVDGAIASFTAAERLADASFAWDVAWYRAVAEERDGDVAAARARLSRLCGQPDARSKTACEALKQLPRWRSVMPFRGRSCRCAVGILRPLPHSLHRRRKRPHKAAALTRLRTSTACSMKPANSKPCRRRGRAFERARGCRTRLGPQRALLSWHRRALVATLNRDARDFGLRCLEMYERRRCCGIGRANLVLNVGAELSGDYAEAEMRATRAVAAYESAGDLRGRALATLNLLRVVKWEVSEKYRLTARSIDDARAVGDRGIEATAFHAWGDGLFANGRYEEAFEKLERAASLYEEMGNRRDLGTVFNSLGRVFRAHGQLGEALRYQLKALDLHQAIGEPLSLMQSLNAVATVHGMLGHVKEAREFYERALVIAERSSSPRIQDFLRANIANLLIQQGEFARAAAMLEEVIASGLDSNVAVRQNQLSNARLHLGQPREALAAAERAHELCGTAANDCICPSQSPGLRRSATNTALADVLQR